MSASEEQDRYETLLLAVASGVTWPRYPFNGKLLPASEQFMEIPSIRAFGRFHRPVFCFEASELGQSNSATKSTVTLHKYTQREVLDAESLLAKIQAEALNKAAEKLVFTLPDNQIGPRKVIHYEQLMHLAVDILATKRPI